MEIRDGMGEVNRRRETRGGEGGEGGVTIHFHTSSTPHRGKSREWEEYIVNGRRRGEGGGGGGGGYNTPPHTLHSIPPSSTHSNCLPLISANMAVSPPR